MPGVDGLDLKLSRYYSLAEAELYTKTAGIEATPVTFILDEGIYIVTETVEYQDGTKSTYQYPYLNEDEALLRIEEIESRDTCDGLYNYYADLLRSNEGDEITVNYYYTSELNQTSYSNMKSNLGAGWSWGFPSVQVIKDNYYDVDEIPKGIYYHDGKGGVIDIECDSSHNYSFSNYIGGDIEFNEEFEYYTDICNTSRIDYSVTDADGTKYYFGIYGELRTIADRFGNKITFTYKDKDLYGAQNCKLISKITDTIGRIVDFDYTDEGEYEYINITVTSPYESEKILSLSYKKKMVDVVDGNELFSAEPILETFTNQMGEVTTYYPALIGGEREYAQPISFTFADKSFDSSFVNNTSGYANNLVYLLGNIVRPNSHTYYEYDNNGNILTTTEIAEEQQNNVTYTYDNLNRISTVSGTKGADSYYEYDSRGNRKASFEETDFLTEENAEFKYDETDKLYYANVGEDETSIEYSSNGYRFVKQENTDMPVYYIYDQSGRLTAEAKLLRVSDSDGTVSYTVYPVSHYVWAPDRVLAKIDNLTGDVYYYLYNGHGYVVQITDTNGNIVNKYDYDVWGNFLKKEETIENPFTYFGQTYDETTGLYYLRARYYDPTASRFTQQDPAEDRYKWLYIGCV